MVIVGFYCFCGIFRALSKDIVFGHFAAIPGTGHESIDSDLHYPLMIE